MTNDPPLPPRTLTLRGLACRRGERTLFEGLDLLVGSGEIAELRGPNGAGKTSLLLTIAGILRPTAGAIRIDGGDPEAREAIDIGFLGHKSAIKPRLTVAENLEFWAALNGRPKSGVGDVLETVGLGAIPGLDAGYLSAGQTRRLALARLILLDRPVWLLDEPTAALDAQGETLVAVLIDDHLDRGGLVIVATHHDLNLKYPARSKALVLGQPNTVSSPA